MLKSVLTKTLYEKRWSTYIWFGAYIFFTVLIVLLFPVLRDAFGESLKDVPESMQKLLGNAEDYQSLSGFVDIQVIGQMVFLTIIHGVLLGTALLAGDENNGTLQTLLAHPVSRSKIFWHKFGALLLLLTGSIITALFLGVIIGQLFVDSSVPLGNLLAASFMTWLLTVFFASLAYALGAITGRRSIAGGLAGVYAFISYTITSIAASAASLKTLDHLSPFHYFNDPSLMRTGLDLTNVLVLTGATLACVIIGWAVFRRRDIYQR